MTTGTYYASFEDGQVPQSLVFPTGPNLSLGFRLSTDAPTGYTYSLAWPQNQGSYLSPDSTNRSVTLSLTSASGGSSVSFYQRTDTQTSHDYLKFYIDDVEQDSWSGTTSWSQSTYTAASGSHEYKWSYIKDVSGTVGEDTPYVAGISITNVVDPPDLHAPEYSSAVYDMEDGQLPASATGDWTNSTYRPISGSRSLQSPDISDSGSSHLTFDSFPATSVVHFSYRTSSETGYDFLKFNMGVDYETVWRMSGVDISGTERIIVPGGLDWSFSYTKDSSDTVGDDAAWIDDLLIPWTSLAHDALISAQSDMTSSGLTARSGSGSLSSEIDMGEFYIVYGDGAPVVQDSSLSSSGYKNGQSSPVISTSSGMTSSRTSLHYTTDSDVNIPIEFTSSASITLIPTSSGLDISSDVSTKKYKAIVTNSSVTESVACEVRLYDTDGTTLLAILDKARNVQFQDELSKPGIASFEVPLSDAKTALIQHDMIVKFAWRGRERFGCVIVSESCEVVKDEYRDLWLKFDSQPGIGHLFSRAVVYPEYSLSNGTLPVRTRSNERIFGFMSKEGNWMVNEDWKTPSSVRWIDDTGIYKGYPPIFKNVDPYAYWLSAEGSLYEFRDPGEIHYLRGSFYLPYNAKLYVYVTADNMVTLYVDGELVLDVDRQKPIQWTESKRAYVELDKGYHLFAARTENSLGIIESVGPQAFIMTAVLVNEESGAPADEYRTWGFDSGEAFVPGTATLTPLGVTRLNTFIANVYGTEPIISVNGYTSSSGDDAADIQLSEDQAIAMKDYILTKITNAAVTATGHGKADPWYTQPDSRNNRVQIVYPARPPGSSPETPIGDYAPAVVFRSHPSTWKIDIQTPGWFRASVVKQLLSEAKARGVLGLNYPADFFTFTDYADSNNVPWTDRGTYTFPVGTANILDVIEQLSESELDWWFDPESWQLNIYIRRGEDLTDSVRLFPGQSLTSLTSSKDSKERFTHMIVRTSSGEWFARPVSPPTDRIEKGMTISSVEEDSTASTVVDNLLDEFSSSVLSFEAEASCNIGPQPYVDYFVGDTILVPGHKNVGVVPARVISITADFSDDIPKVYPELVLDDTSPAYVE